MSEKSVSLSNETNILKRRFGSIPQWDVVTSKERLEVKLDAKEESTSNNDPSIFDDAYDDTERLFSGLGYYSALNMLSSSAFIGNDDPNRTFTRIITPEESCVEANDDAKSMLSTSGFAENERPLTNNAYLSDINSGNDSRKPGFSRIITPDETCVAAKNDAKSNMTQSSDLMPLTKQTSKAFAQELAGNPASTRRPFTSNDTLKSLADVASSNLLMPKTENHDVPFKSCDMGLEMRATATNHEAKHDIANPNIASMTETEKVQLVISNASICDIRFSRNIQPLLLSSSENINGVTFLAEDEITEADILSGRGGKSNHHVGNKRFRHLVSEMKSMYRSAGQKTDKTALSQGIIAYVHSYGGRFLIQDRTANDPQWRVMTTLEARKKTSQALRETKALKWTLDKPNSVMEST